MQNIKLTYFVLFFSLMIISSSIFASYGWTGKDLSGLKCYGATGNYGPYDYKIATAKKIDIVLSYHFTPSVQNLIKGRTGSLSDDLSYTLNALPNYHPALFSLIRLYFRYPKKYGNLPPPECFLLRAQKFRPNQSQTYSLFGYYLHKLKKYKLAEEQYRTAIKFDPKNSETHYNYALMLIDMKKFKKAKKHARLAYKYGFPLRGLKRKLKRLGHPI